MADLNQQAQDLAEIMERVNDEMRRFGRISEETADALAAGSATRAKELKAGGAAAVDALSALGKAVGSVASAMYEGKQGAGAFNDSLDLLTVAAGSAAAMLTFVGGPVALGLKIFGGAVALATAGLVDYTKKANDMADKLYKGYSGLAKVGAVASDGMRGLEADAIKLGFGMNELENFVQLVTDNSKDLALFGGSAFEGRKKFADLGEAMKGSREAFMRLGMLPEEQAKALAGYVRLQARLGTDQSKTVAEMAESAKKYIVEQDALTKLTGASREEQEKIQESALMEQQFRAKVRQLELDGNVEGAKRLQELNKMYSTVSPELGKSMRALATGNLKNADANKLFASTQGQALDDIEAVIAGTKQPIQALNSTAKVLGEVSDSVGTTAAMFEMNNESFFDYGAAQQIRVAQAAGNFRSMETIEAAAAAQLDAKGDQLVAVQAELLAAEQKARDAAQSLVSAGLVPAQAAMLKLAKATESAANGVKNMTSESAAATGARYGGALGAIAGYLGAKLFGKGEAEPPINKSASGTVTGGGRRNGSLGATGKLIEDFGEGTLMTLHGRESVITEKQLTKFAESAMSMQGNFSMPGLGDGPGKIQEIAKQQINTQLSILELAKDEQDFTEKQNRIQERMTNELRELQTQEFQKQKDFIDKRESFYSIILTGIKDVAKQTTTTPITANKVSSGGVINVAPTPKQPVAAPTPASNAVSPPPARAAGTIGGGLTTAAAPPPPPPASDGQGVSTPSAAPAAPPPKRKKGGGAMSEQDIKNMITQHEGIRYEPYKDSLGLWTVGVGHLIGDGKTLPDQWNRKFTPEEVMQLFDKDYEHHRLAAEKIPGFNALNDKGQGALTDLTFNMGPGWISKWPTLKKQLGAEDVDAAAANLENSKWYGQVGNRAPKITGMLREGISAAEGGMFSGPISGYPATLHGNEAVIPLKDGNVPAEIPKIDDLIDQNAGVRIEIESLRTDMTRLMNNLTKALTDGNKNSMQEQMLEVLQNIAKTNSASADASHKLVQAARN